MKPYETTQKLKGSSAQSRWIPSKEHPILHHRPVFVIQKPSKLSGEYGTAISFEMTHSIVPKMWLFSTSGPLSDGRENRSNFSSILKSPSEKLKK